MTLESDASPDRERAGDASDADDRPPVDGGGPGAGDGTEPAERRAARTAEPGTRTGDRAGTVYLVGAGPGDPDYLTVKARRVIDAADVLLHDSLTTDALLDTVPAATDVLNVGKRADGERTSQAEINRLLVERARAGDAVVRLKGGDPTVFGRGGEEAQHLAERGVDFEFVPGVSSVLSPSLSGIPLTHRDHASSLTVVTGHEDPEKDASALDWDALASTVAAGGTLVVLMGVRRLPAYVSALRERGVADDTPVAMIQRATWEDEQTVTGTLETIVSVRDDAGVAPPAITVVGEVVSVRDDLADHLERTALADVPPRVPERPPEFAGGVTN